MAFGGGFLPPLVAELKGEITDFQAKMGKAIGTMTDVENKAMSTGEKVQAALAKGFTAAGGAAFAMGAIFTHMAAPLETAEADMKTALDNTGGAIEGSEEKIRALQSTEEKYAHSKADTLAALAKGTTALGSEKAALAAMPAVTELAALKHEDLTAAMKQFVLATEGNAKALKELGITSIPKVSQELAKLSAATKAEAAASQTLSDLQAKAATSAQEASAKQVEAQAAQAAAAKQTRDALANLTTAKADFDRIATGPSVADATKAFDAVQNAARGTRDAVQKVTDAKQALDDLLKGPSADTKGQAQENVAKATTNQEKATLSLQDAQANLANLERSGTATARQLEDAHIAVTEAQFGLQDAQRGVAQSQAALTKLQTDSLPGSQAMVQAQNNLSDAEQALKQAKQNEADATAKQTALYADALPTSQAYQDAQRKLADAQDAVTTAQRSAAAQTIAADQAALTARKDSEALAKALATEKKATDDLTAAKSAASGPDAATIVANAIMAKGMGAAENQAKTFHGQISALKVKIEDTAASIGAKYGPAITGAGMAMMGLGQIMPVLGAAFGAILPLIGTFGMALGMLPELLVALGGGLATAASAAIGFGAALLVNPITWIIIAIIALAFAIYEIVKHWSTVKKWISEFWDWLWGFLKTWGPAILVVLMPFIGIPLLIFQHWGTIEKWFKELWDKVWSFFKKWGPDILAVLVPFVGIPLFIFQHWGEIEKFFKELWGKVSGWFASGVDAAVREGGRIVKWFTSLPGKIGDAIGDAGSWLVTTGGNILIGLWNGIVGWEKKLWGWFLDLPKNIWDALGDASKWLVNTGVDLITGLWNGIASMGSKLSEWVMGFLNNIPGFGLIKQGIGAIGNLLGFDQGGVVPGPKGAPMLAVVHGGETVVPADYQNHLMVPPALAPSSSSLVGGGGGDVHVSINVPGLVGGTVEQIATAMVEPMRQALTIRARSVPNLFGP